MKTLPPRRPKMPKLDLILSATSVSLSVSVSLAVAVLLCCTGFISAERDFNFNDSQVPLLEPKDEPRHIKYGQPQDPYAVEVSRCDYADTEILLTLVLKNHDWHDLSDNKKAKVLRKLSKFFAIPKEFIVMESVKKRDLNEMQKSAIRKGENKCHSKRQFGRVNFMLGCGASYFPMGELIANQIGAQMKDGSIDGITGEEFGWWVIWRKDFSIRAPRSRRQVEGSGESDFDYEDDYEYEDDEEETADTVTEVPTVPTHAHRHHHGTSDTQDGTDETTLLPSSNQDAHAKASMTPPTTNDVAEGTSSSSTTVLTPMTAASSTPEPIATDYIDLKPENTPPMIKTRLQKLAITSGKSFRLTVPAETFYDNEDNTNLRLVLTEKDGRELKPTSWLQFNAETREIYGLPLDDTVSKYQYLLSATDSGNESVTETVEISVQQHHSVRSVNHEINIAVKINDKQMYNIDWQVKLIRAIATTLDDATTDAIVVREIRQATQDPNTANFVYFNETLPTATCPEAELNSLVKRFDASRLSDLVSPTLGVKSITGQLIGTCQKLLTSKPKPTTHTMKNAPPMPRNQVDRVNATVNHLLVYKVPSDTFYDPSDSDLKLSLRAKDNKEISPSNWLQFDSKNQEFYGIPKSSDFGSEEYILVAEDSGGLTATDALVVVVSHAPKKEFGVFFKAYLAIRLEQFNADLQRKFVERVAELFGDHTTQYVQLRSVNTDRDSDGIIVNFYNTTLFKAHNRCPDEQIEAVRNVYLMQDHTLRDRVKKALGSELNLTNLKVSATSSCDPKIDGPHRESTPTKTETEPTLKSTFAHDHMYTVILPAVIIVTMIVIASLIACCLHRRRRKSGKMELGDEEERKSFRAKGIPVIFQDELDEKPEIGNKSPIILKDEKPPLLPPSYNTSNMNGDTDVDEYVPPPAVVVGGREVRGKSPATPSYRKPPPYVSP